MAVIISGCSRKHKPSTSGDNVPSEIAITGSRLGKSEVKTRISDLSSGWNSWQTASLSGHLEMDGLPLNPTLKVGMLYDKTIALSVRAPFLGEVATAEIDTDSVFIVNRMNRTYVAESISHLFENYPVSVADMQNLLLRRAFIPSRGLLTPDIATDVEITPSGDSFAILPNSASSIPGFLYGYEMSADNKLTALFVRPVSRDDQSVAVGYGDLRKGYSMNVEYGDSTRVYDASLVFDNVSFESGAPAKLNLSRKFERLPVGEFIKKLKSF